MRKYIPIHCLLLLIVQNPLQVFAQTEPLQPYIVTTQINHQPVDQEACRILLTNTSSTVENQTANEASGQEETNQLQMEEINQRFTEINQEITFIESESPDSLHQANLTLEEVVEKLYQEYTMADESFSQLSADEQVTLISHEPVVLEWQAYIESLNHRVNELVNERVTLENDYQELLYQSQQLESERTVDDSSLAQLNQCELYAYSAPVMNPDQILINQETGSLSQYLVKIDQYLQKLVPLAYQKVSFEDIYHLYNRQLTEEQIALILNGKENMVVDSQALDYYSYAKELSLFDVELMAAMAADQLNRQSNPNDYQASYESLLSLKEKQLNYFYDLNTAAFEKIKSDLAAYLNHHYHVDDDAVHQMQSLHQRYQMKLVLYDPVSISWSPVAGAQSAYIENFIDLDLAPIDSNNTDNEREESSEEEHLEDNLEVSSIEEITDELLVPESNSYLMPPVIEDESIINSHSEETLESVDNLAYLKEKLAQKNPGGTQLNTDDLTQPSESNLRVDLKDETKNADKEDTGKDKAKLPSTGEQRFYMWLALGLMFIGLALLAFNRYLKYRQRQQAEPVELD